jgi:hypothetical protein
MKRERCKNFGFCHGWQQYPELGLCKSCYEKREQVGVRSCVLPGCDREAAYTTLQLCRSCYNRINWFARRHDKTTAEALEAVKEIDAVLIRHGCTDHGKPKSPHQKKLTSSPAPKKGQQKRELARGTGKA